MHFKEAHYAHETKSRRQAGVDRKESGVCVCVLIGSGESALGQQVWANRYPIASAEPGGVDVPVRVAASATHVYAGGTRSVGGVGVFAITQHEISSGGLEQDFQWPLAGNDGLTLNARAMTFIPNPEGSLMEMVLAGTYMGEDPYLRPITISVLGNDSGEEMHLQWSTFDNPLADELGNDVPVALSLGLDSLGVFQRVGVLTDTDGGRGRFRVYIYEIGTGRLRGYVKFPSSMWQGADDIPVGLGLTPTEAWVAVTHIASTGVRSGRVYRFSHSGQLLQSPLTIGPATGTDVEVKATHWPYDITEGVMLLACQDRNAAGTSSDYLTVHVGINNQTGLLEELGRASEDFDTIDIPTAITAEVYLAGASSDPPGYLHTHVTGTAQSSLSSPTDIATVQYGAPDPNDPYRILPWEWDHRLPLSGTEIPHALHATFSAIPDPDPQNAGQPLPGSQGQPRLLLTGTTEVSPGVFRYITLVYTAWVNLPSGQPRLRLQLVGPEGQETNRDIGLSVYGHPYPNGMPRGSMTGRSLHPVNNDDFVTVQFVWP
jgi:hypothetical protein